MFRYDAFMRAFGGTNSLQATSQTGEDNIQVDLMVNHKLPPSALSPMKHDNVIVLSPFSLPLRKKKRDSI